MNRELLKTNEIEVNEQSRKSVYIFGLICILGCVVVILTDDRKYLMLDLGNCAFLALAFCLMFVINIMVSVNSPAYKYLFLLWTFIPVLVESVLTTDYFWIAFALPILLSCRYYRVRLVVIISIISQVFLGIANVGIAYIQPSLGYIRAGSVYLPKGTMIISKGQWMSEIAADLIQSGVVSRQEYLLVHYKTHVAYISILLACVSVCCILITIHGLHVLQNQAMILEEKRIVDIKLAESRNRTMLSQIQPHFIFNVLSTLRALCKTDPDQAREMIGVFAAYLRHNIDVLSNTGLVSFQRELEAVRNYLTLEKLRFDDRLNVEMDLQIMDFSILPLTIQPLIENAVKHGICKKPEGGTVTLKTYVEGDEVVIRVQDDGVGFVPEDVMKDGRTHVGLSNVVTRLESQMGATVTIKSEPGVGTDITIHLPGGRFS